MTDHRQVLARVRSAGPIALSRVLALAFLAGCTGEISGSDGDMMGGGSGNIAQGGGGTTTPGAGGAGSSSSGNASGSSSGITGGNGTVTAGSGGMSGTTPPDPTAGTSAGGTTSGTGGVGSSGATTGPATTLNLSGHPQYYRVVRLTNSQWARSVQDVLKLPAPSGLEVTFQEPVSGTTDFTNNELVLTVDQRVSASLAVVTCLASVSAASRKSSLAR